MLICGCGAYGVIRIRNPCDRSAVRTALRTHASQSAPRKRHPRPPGALSRPFRDSRPRVSCSLCRRCCSLRLRTRDSFRSSSPPLLSVNAFDDARATLHGALLLDAVSPQLAARPPSGLLLYSRDILSLSLFGLASASMRRTPEEDSSESRQFEAFEGLVCFAFWRIRYDDSLCLSLLCLC